MFFGEDWILLILGCVYVVVGPHSIVPGVQGHGADSLKQRLGSTTDLLRFRVSTTLRFVEVLSDMGQQGDSLEEVKEGGDIAVLEAEEVDTSVYPSIKQFIVWRQTVQVGLLSVQTNLWIYP